MNISSLVISCEVPSPLSKINISEVGLSNRFEVAFGILNKSEAMQPYSRTVQSDAAVHVKLSAGGDVWPHMSYATNPLSILRTHATGRL